MHLLSTRRLRARLQLVQGKVKLAVSFLFCTIFFLLVDYFLGLAAIILEKDFESDFSYPLDVENFPALIDNFRNGETVEFEPINRLYTKPKFLEKADSSCNEFKLMVILVKSAPSNFENRNVIRNTWGNPQYLKNISNLIRANKLATNSNNNRFSLPKYQHSEPNANFKLVFLIGLVPTINNPTDQHENAQNVFYNERLVFNPTEKLAQQISPKYDSNEENDINAHRLDEDIKKESEIHQDIVRIETVDTYSNNTYKTMMGIRWASEICTDFEYALLVDDDMYISIKNLITFLESPGTYPDGGRLEEIDTGFAGRQIVDANRLYAGKVLFTKPIRQRIGSYSKWYLSLEEYPYNYFPRYMPAAAIVMSKQVVEDFYYASYYTKHFRFDDIYLGIMAYKMNIIPYSSSYFYVCHTEDGKCPGLITSVSGRKLFDGIEGGLPSVATTSYEDANSEEDMTVVELMEHVIARHGLSSEQLIDLWHELTVAGKT